MSLPVACCTLPPVQSNYVPKGTVFQLGDISTYETGDKECEHLLICAYDIFGVHPVTKQFCDKLTTSNNFRVVMPDFFRGKLPLKDMSTFESLTPEERGEVFKSFMATTGSWDNIAKNDLPKIIEHYKGQGAKSFGIFGFCWGARLCIEANVQLANDIKALVLIHPSMVGTDDADRVTSPTLALPTKDDADFVPFYKKLQAKFSKEQCGHHRFEDVHHGFAAARGNLDDELNRKRIDEAISLTYNFFKTNLN